jgi:hypothetical protein
MPVFGLLAPDRDHVHVPLSEEAVVAGLFLYPRARAG